MGFTRELASGNELLVYDHETWRPYCHVKDFARLIQMVIEYPSEELAFNVFNAGGEVNNATKQMIVDFILEKLPDGKVKYREHGNDPRNYRVSFNKVKSVTKKLMQLSHDMPIRVGTRPTITVYNVLDIPNITNWWMEMMDKYYSNNKVWINHTHAALPNFLSLPILSKHCKDIVMERLWDKGRYISLTQSLASSPVPVLALAVPAASGGGMARPSLAIFFTALSSASVSRVRRTCSGLSGNITLKNRGRELYETLILPACGRYRSDPSETCGVL